jgi:hypothetical protein
MPTKEDTMNVKKQEVADELVDAAWAVVSWAKVHAWLSDEGRWLEQTAGAYRDAGPWPTAITPPLEIGDEADAGPTRDLLFGLTTALQNCLRQMREGSPTAMWTLFQILHYQPEEDVRRLHSVQLERMYHDRTNPPAE